MSFFPEEIYAIALTIDSDKFSLACLCPKIAIRLNARYACVTEAREGRRNSVQKPRVRQRHTGSSFLSLRLFFVLHFFSFVLLYSCLLCFACCITLLFVGNLG